MRQFLFALWIGVVGIVHANAQNLNAQIHAARQSGQWDAVRSTVQQLAKTDNPVYLTALGQMHFYGVGSPQDLKTAHSLLLKAAQKGYAPAQAFVAHFYATGSVVEKNVSTALDWYKKSADQGFSGGQHMLGTLYQFGEGVSASPKQALQWYEKAAAQGYAPSLQNMATLYLQGSPDIPQDIAKGVSLMKQAANLGSSDAQANVANLYITGLGASPDPRQAYYYFMLASMDDTRGPCLPPMLWVAARIQSKTTLAEPVITQEEMSRSLCMRANPQAKTILERLDKAAQIDKPWIPVFQEMRQMALKSMETRKIMDAPEATAKASPAPAAPVPNPIIPVTADNAEYARLSLPAQWRVQHLNQTVGAARTTELRPQVEPAPDNSQVAHFEWVPQKKFNRPRQYVSTPLNQARQDCPDLQENILHEGEERGYLTYFLQTYCPQTSKDQRSEMRFYKAVQGDDGVYLWQTVWRGPKDAFRQAKDTANQVTRNFISWMHEQYVCDRRTPTGPKACPKTPAK